MLDAGTQEGFTGTPLIELNGASAGPVSGLTLAGTGGSTVRGFVINRFTGNGILVNTNSNGNSIVGNWIGTDATGAADLGTTATASTCAATATSSAATSSPATPATGSRSRRGLRQPDHRQLHRHQHRRHRPRSRNSGSASTCSAEQTRSAAPPPANATSSRATSSRRRDQRPQAIGNLVQGNLIGTNAAGTPAGRQRHRACSISGGATGNQIGGTGLNAGNTIAFNSQDGVQVTGGAATAGNTISGNAFRQNNGLGIDLANDNVTSTTAPSTPTPARTACRTPAAPRGGNQRRQPQRPIRLREHRGPEIPDRVVRLERAGSERLRRGPALPRSATVTTDAAGIATSTAHVRGRGRRGRVRHRHRDRSASANTSEFSNAVVAGDRTISGTIHHDVNGNANVADDGGAVFPNAANAARLYLDNGNGAIDAGDLSPARRNRRRRHYIVRRSGERHVLGRRRLEGVVSAAPNVWAEQTYGADSEHRAARRRCALRRAQNAAISDDATTLATPSTYRGWGRRRRERANVDLGFIVQRIVNVRGATATTTRRTRRLRQGTLRQFILNSNTLAGAQTANFSIGATGSAQSIAVPASVPAITDTVVLDARTQAATGFAARRSSNWTAPVPTERRIPACVDPGGSMVRGFVINRFRGDGLHVEAATGSSSATGSAPTRRGPLGNGEQRSGAFTSGPISTASAAPEPTSATSSPATGPTASIVDDSTGNVVRGNYIGTEPAGDRPRQRRRRHLHPAAARRQRRRRGRRGAERHRRQQRGRYRDHRQHKQRRRNYIGLDATGAAALGNGIG